ncbi:peptidylprolyl isomerase [Limobrevibacterium gyesilva]|uniref:Parvulin-like PPIase n=1 Tax=Limobrevibacterium gyesilva TaxID=2991712 RepID=A0AA42CE74_9PROT|nr:peptidylprolyl isomerase [Limobrevibacterium gyesilva]MCW3473146.1 peptidylprolyl isomerase [Limobrevibacterium gyesilva]
MSPAEGSVIVAVVNGEVISLGDVDNRRRLFALSTGMGISADVLARLTPQVTRQLVDERLRLQEIQRRHIVVTDKEIAAAIGEVETRNGMPPGTLRRRLAADGVEMRTMIDQIRVQIGWGRVLREVLGAQAQVTGADIKQQEDLLKAQVGQPEFRISEIFVPVADPAQAEEARRFADTVIEQLRAGAPFSVVAAQFSQSQTALQGGDLGWVQPNEMDPAVLRVAQEMPVGAISNPIQVPGGLSIVTLRAKREIGREPATMLSVRQVFFRFATPLDPNNPNEQQRQALEQARRVSVSVKGCDGMEAAAKAAGDEKGGNPGELRLESVAVPALRQLMATLPLEKASQPLIADDGAAVVMVCSRDQRNLGVPNRNELAERILNDRVELTARQLMRDLQRRAMIDRRA